MSLKFIKNKYSKFIRKQYLKLGLNQEEVTVSSPTSKYQEIELDNEGERLIPGCSHNKDEFSRHRSSYDLYKNIIIQDIVDNPEIISEEIKILDLGCGCGHGAYYLSSIPNSKVYALDISENAVNFAKKEYNAKNIEYICSNMEEFAKQNDIEFDYVVSRGVLEHVEAGVDIALEFGCKRRYIISVPYMEPAGNPHHIHLEMDETIFDKYENPEFVYEDMMGGNYLTKEVKPNIIHGISSKSGKKVEELLNFPQKPYEFMGIEKIYFEEFFN